MSYQTKHIHYKTRQSKINQDGHLRLTHNQVRKDKNSRYRKVKTSLFTSLADEMKYYSDMEYICAGLNSYEREVMVVDCDDDSGGENTMKALKVLGLVPHFQKVKPSNGHSQTFFFVEKYRIGSAGFECGKFWEKDDEAAHEKWKLATKMLNLVACGDLGYTGYNCQNPYYANGVTNSYRPLDELYTVDEIYDKCLEALGNVSDIRGCLSYLRRKAEAIRESPSPKSEERKIRYVIHFDDEERARREILDRYLIRSEIRETISEIIEAERTTINTRIFVLASQVCKSFRMRNRLTGNDFDYILNTCLKHWHLQDEATGYTEHELVNRFKSDITQIMRMDSNNSMDWSKVGYTGEQRKLSLITRHRNMTIRRKRINSLIKEHVKELRELSLHAMCVLLSKFYLNSFNETISPSTIRNYFKIDYVRNMFNKKLSLNLRRYIRKTLMKKDVYVQHNNRLTNCMKFTDSYRRFIASYGLKRIKLKTIGMENLIY